MVERLSVFVNMQLKVLWEFFHELVTFNVLQNQVFQNQVFQFWDEYHFRTELILQFFA